MSVFRKKTESGGARHAAADTGGQEEPEIRVHGYHMSVTWWQRRLIIQHHRHWNGAIEITPDACGRADYARRDVPGGSEWVLSIRLRAGSPGDLWGVLEIAIPLGRGRALENLVARVNAEISTREYATRSSGELLVQAPALPSRPASPPQPQSQPLEPRLREESPRLRPLAFLQAPDDEEWITFRPLRTAEDVRASIPLRQHG